MDLGDDQAEVGLGEEIEQVADNDEIEGVVVERQRACVGDAQFDAPVEPSDAVPGLGQHAGRDVDAACGAVRVGPRQRGEHLAGSHRHLEDVFAIGDSGAFQAHRRAFDSARAAQTS